MHPSRAVLQRISLRIAGPGFPASAASPLLTYREIRQLYESYAKDEKLAPMVREINRIESEESQ
jgi:hypothetical protein